MATLQNDLELYFTKTSEFKEKMVLCFIDATCIRPWKYDFQQRRKDFGKKVSQYSMQQPLLVLCLVSWSYLGRNFAPSPSPSYNSFEQAQAWYWVAYKNFKMFFSFQPYSPYGTVSLIQRSCCSGKKKTVHKWDMCF